MPFWNLYLEDQGFNYQEIGLLSSIAIITCAFRAVYFGGGLPINLAKECLLVHIAHGWNPVSGS